MIECYPKAVSAIQMDYGSKDLMKIQVTMQYKNWRGVAGEAAASESAEKVEQVEKVEEEPVKQKKKKSKIFLIFLRKVMAFCLLMDLKKDEITYSESKNLKLHLQKNLNQNMRLPVHQELQPEFCA